MGDRIFKEGIMKPNHDVRKIITVSPARLGDTIFCTPLLRMMKQYFPLAGIDVIALSPVAAAVLEHNPNIHAVFLEPDQSTLDKIKKDYDLAINMHLSPRANEYLKAFDAEYLEYSDETLEGLHQTEKLLRYFSNIFEFDLDGFDPKYDLFPQAENHEKIRKIFKENNIVDDDIVIGYHMGCHGIAKKHTRFWKNLTHRKAWPLKNFIKLSKKLKNDKRVRIIITGSKEEIKLDERFCKKVPGTINLIDKTSVLDLAALMTYLNLFITNDTGALHIACSTDVPLIGLFGPTDPKATGPYPITDNRIILRKNKLSDILPDEVIETIRKMKIINDTKH